MPLLQGTKRKFHGLTRAGYFISCVFLFLTIEFDASGQSCPSSISFTTSPTSQTVCSGDPAVFQANITGAVVNDPVNNPVQFDWQRKRPADAGFTSIGAPNSTILTIANAGSPADPDQTEYRVVITDDCGVNATTSAVAVLSVNSTPTITAQPPANHTISVGCTANLSVTAAGSSPITYQWRKNGVAIGGAVSNTYSISGITAGDAGDYDVVVTNSCGAVTSANSILSVNSPCAITGGSDAVCPGGTTTWQAPAGMTGYSWTGPNGFNATSQTIEIGAVGTYVLTVTDPNGCQLSCSRILSANPGPTVDPITNQTICNGASTAAIIFSGAVAGTTFNWTNSHPSIGLAASGNGNIVSFAAVNTGSTPVVATISVTPSANGCTGPTETFTITVNPTPTVVDPANQVVCNGASTSVINFSGTVAGTTYTWTNSLPAIGLASSGSGDIAAFTAINSGTTSVTATLAVTPLANGCTGPSQSFTIRANPTPTVTDPANQVVCNNSATTAIVFSGSVSGTTFNWTNDNTSIGLGASGTGNIAAFSGTNAGSNAVTATITVTPVANGCPGLSQTFDITIDPTPTISATPATQTICSGTAITQIDITNPNNLPGTTFSWTRTNTTNLTGIANSGTGTSISGIFTNNSSTQQTTTFTITATTGSCSNTTTVTVIVNPRPTINATNTNQTICSGSAITNIVITNPNIVSGTTFSWTRDNSVNLTGIAASGTGSPISGTLTNTTNIAQITTFTISASSPAGCSSPTTATATITVNPRPTVSATPVTQTICSGTAITQIDISNPNDVAGTIFSWTRTNTTNLTGIAASGTGTSISGILDNNTSTQQTTTFTIIATAGSCTNTTTVTVIVNPRPTVSATNINQTICSGSPIASIVITNPNAVAGTTFSWTRDNSINLTGIAASGTESPISGALANTTNIAQTTTFTITASSPAGCLSPTTATATITVNPRPTVSATPATQTICSGTGITQIDITNPNNLPGTTFSWTRTNTTNLTGIANSGTGTFISGILDNNTSTQQTTTFTITATAGSCTNTTTITVIVNPRPTVSATNINQTICSGSAITNIVITNPNIVSGTTFSWTRDNSVNLTGIAASGTGSPISGTLTNTTNIAQITTFTITASSPAGCLSPTTATATITVNPRPTVSATPVTQTICSGTAITQIDISNPNDVAGTIFSWTRTNTTNLTGIAPSGTGNSISGILTNNTSTQQTTTFTIIATAGSCTNTTTITVVVNPRPTVSATNTNQTICSGSAITNIVITNPNIVSGTTFSWTRDNTTNLTGIAASGTGSPISGTLINANGTQQVTTFTIVASTAAGCSNTTTATITVNPRPTVTATPSTQTLCSGTAITQIDISNPNNVPGTTFSWTRTNTTNLTGIAASGTGTAINGIFSNNTNTQQTTTFTITATAGSCTSTTTVTVIVNPRPTVSATNINQTICSGSAITNIVITNPNNVSGTTFSWTRDNTTNLTGIAASGTGSPISGTLTNTNGTQQVTTFTIVASTAAGCSSTTTATITVNPRPTVNATPSTQTICTGTAITAINIDNPNNVAGATFSWTRTNTSNLTGIAASGTGNIITGAFTNNTTTQQTTTFTITATAGSCTSTTTVTVVVNPRPAAPTNPVNGSRCGPGTVNLSATSAAGTTIDWYDASTGGTLVGSGTNFITPSITATTIFYAGARNLSTGCSSSTRLAVTATINALPNVSASTPAPICAGFSTTLTASGAVSYVWSPSTGLSSTIGSTVTASPAATTTYTITGTGANGCSNTANVTVEVTPSPDGGIISPPVTVACANNNSGTLTLSGNDGAIVRWESSTNAGATWTQMANTTNTLTYSNLNQTTLYRALIENGDCSAYSATAVVSVIPFISPTATANPTLICVGDSSTLSAIASGFPGSWSGVEDFNNASLDNSGNWIATANGGPHNIEASADNELNTPFNLTNPKEFNGVTYNSGDPKFAIAAGLFNSTMETPAFSTVGMSSAVFSFQHAFNLNAGAIIKVEISIDGGATYQSVPLFQAVGPTSLGTPNLGFVTTYLDLSNYLGQSNLKIRFNYQGSAGSNWAIDNAGLQLPPVPLTYAWTLTDPAGVPSPYYLNATDQATVRAGPPTPGTYVYTVTTTYGGCAGGSANVSVIVRPTPTATISGTTTVCQNSTPPLITFTNPQAFPVTITYNINGGSNLTINVPANGTATVTVPLGTVGVFVYNLVSVAYQNGSPCTAPVSGSATVTVLPIPNVTISGTSSVCLNGASPVITFTNPTAWPVTATYTINSGANTTIDIAANSTATVTVPTTATGTFTYSLVSVAYQPAPLCSRSVTGSVTITVDPIPTCTITGSISVFAGSPGNTYSTTILPAGGTVTYAWTISGNGVITGLANGSSVSVTAGATGTYTLTSTVTRNGCPTTCSITVDVNAPTAILSGGAIVCIGSSASLSVAFTGNAPWSFTYTDGATPVTITNINATPYTFTVSPSVTTTYSLISMSDANGAGTVSGTATITISPQPECSISGDDNVCPSSTNIYSAPAGIATYNWSISGNATISGSTTGQNVSVVAGAACGPYTLTLLTTNSTGCNTTCSQTFNATDNVNPVITLTASTNPACNPTTAQIAAAFGIASVTDNCSTGLTATYTDGAETGTGCARSITRTWTVTDACGNTATQTQTIAFTRDVEPPVITVTASTALACNPTAAQIAAAFGSASVTDNCSTGLTATFTDGAETGTGCARSITRTWTVTDACGNTGTQTQTITFTRDTEAPVINCSPTVLCVNSTNNYTVPPLTATDNCGGALTITYQVTGATTRSGTGTDASGLFNVGVSTITWTVTDGCGNISTCSTTVTINPIPTPIIYHN